MTCSVSALPGPSATSAITSELPTNRPESSHEGTNLQVVRHGELSSAASILFRLIIPPQLRVAVMRHLMPIVTPRLVLRPPTLGDLDSIQTAKEEAWPDLQRWMA